MKLEIVATLKSGDRESSQRFSFEVPFGNGGTDVRSKLMDLLNVAMSPEDMVNGLCDEIEKLDGAPEQGGVQQQSVNAEKKESK